MQMEDMKYDKIILKKMNLKIISENEHQERKL